MFLHEERPLCDYSHPFNPQHKNYAYCPPTDWKDTVHRGQSWDGVVAGSEPELSSLPVRVSLQGRELWEQFRDLGTEMLITKTGRRMFPSCKVTVTGLNPRAKYVLMMDMVPFDDNKYKWSKDRWEVSGTTEPHLPNRFFIHPDSPSLGERWMEFPVSFHKLKLTNNTLNSSGMVILHSMHKYLPRLHVVQSPGGAGGASSAGYLRFTFPEAAFFAVTAYQNTEITKLKIDNNPFAKGFRDNGLNRKRFREKEKIISNHMDGRQQIKPLNVSRFVAADDDEEDDLTVSSSVDSSSQGAECRLDDSAPSSSATAPINPFISAFMSLGGGAGPPCGQEGWGHAHRAHSAYSVHTARDYSSPVHADARLTGFPSVASPLLSHAPLGQTHTGPVGFRRPPLQCSRAGGGPPRHHHPGLLGAAPDLPQQQHHHLPPPDHQGALQHQHQQTEFDHPHPHPPKLSRMHLSDSALRCLGRTPVSDPPGGPWPLNDILNRIHSRGGGGAASGAGGSPGKQQQLQAPQYQRPPGVGAQLYPAPLDPAGGHYLPVHGGGMGLLPHSLVGGPGGGALRDGHVGPRGPPSSSSSLEYKTPVPDFV